MLALYQLYILYYQKNTCLSIVVLTFWYNLERSRSIDIKSRALIHYTFYITTVAVK
jgi:hypothetical protein